MGTNCFSDRKGPMLVLRHIALANMLLGLTFASQPTNAALAGEASGYSKNYDRCVAAANGITAALLDCNGQEWDRQDARLNAVYRRLIARLDTQQRAILRRSERHWLATRHAECEKVAGSAGTGTLSSIAESDCLLSDLVDRRHWLERYKPR